LNFVINFISYIESLIDRILLFTKFTKKPHEEPT